MTDAFELVIEKAAFIPLCAEVALTKKVQNNENFLKANQRKDHFHSQG
jgi:hypothetical protein